MSSRFSTPPGATPAIGNGALLIAGLWSAAGLFAAIWTIFRPIDGSQFAFDSRQLSLLAVALPLASASYLLRIFRWHRLMIRLMPGLDLGKSLLAQIAAFGLTVTPARLGEASKLYFVRRGTDVPLARIAPLLIIERLVEGASFIGIALGAGLLLFPADRIEAGLKFAPIPLLLVLAGIAVLNIPAVRSWIVGRVPAGTKQSRFSAGLHEFISGCWNVFGFWTVLEALVFSFAARICDALLFGVAVWSTGYGISPIAAMFVFGSAGTVGGFSMLPGGVGAVEATMTALLTHFGVPVAEGLSASLITRAFVLWLWVALGLVVLIARLRRLRSLE